MKCPECGLEMMIYRANVTAEGRTIAEYVCANKRCPRFDVRLKRTQEAPEEKAQQYE